MELKSVNLLRDGRINSLSVSALTTIGDYMKWFDTCGEANKLTEQRPQLNTRSANMIRRRLIEDLRQGAVIPPIVIGISTPAALNYISVQNVEKLINDHLEYGTVIDGIQRSVALREAKTLSPGISHNPIRVDFWIANSTTALIYRMLVLNTGQTPWDIKRQMEVIYKPLIIEARQRIEGIVLNEKDDQKRRRTGGEYPASSIIELLIAYSSRKEIVNANDSIADEFTKLDITDMAGKREFSENFYKCLSMMVRFDIAVTRYQQDDGEVDGRMKFRNGMDLFTQMPAKTGLIAALAQRIVGMAGMPERSQNEQETIISHIESSFSDFITRIDRMDNETLGTFLCYDVLNEMMANLPVKRIGNAQREFFRKGFAALLENNFGVETLELAWRAY